MKCDLLDGIFIKEENTRFSCLVQINGRPENCYIASSCKLGKFIELRGKKVLLKPISSKKSGMRYGVFAIENQQGWVLLNLAEANRIVEKHLCGRRFCFLGNRKLVEREKKIENYKSDLFLPESKTIIEVKTVLSDKKESTFPSVKTDRAKIQLTKILALLEKGYKVCYLFVILNPITKKVKIDEGMQSLFEECLSKGMICKAYSLKFVDDEHRIHGKVKVLLGTGEIGC